MSTPPPKVKPSPLPENTSIGGYRVLRRLAAGGFGVVYLALDREGQQVASKEYLPASLATRAPGELQPQVAPEKLSLYRLGLKSFFEEGRALAQIAHSSVVTVLNFFRENETVYMVMDYLEAPRCRSSSSRRAASSTRRCSANPPFARSSTKCCAACAWCISTACCIWTSNRPTSSSPTTTAP